MAKQFAQALDSGVETAYKAVMKPVEGTILTVAKDSANKAVQVSETDRRYYRYYGSSCRRSKSIT